MKVLVYEYRWCDDDPMKSKFQASAGGRYGEKIIGIGDDISVEVCSDVRCGGSMRDNEWKPCSVGSMGRKKCETCRAREGQFVFTSFDGFNTDNLTQDDLARIDGPHLVYLAMFERDLVKVGVCKKDRKVLRQVEQGSHATLFFAETDNGILARQIETTMRKSGIADKIQANKKKNALTPELTADECESILRENFDHYVVALDHFPNLKKFVLETPEFCMWEDFYGLDYLRQNEKPFHSIKLDVGEMLSGRIVTRKGAFFVVETPEELVSVNAKDLVGRDVEYEFQPSGLKLNQAVQNSLF